MRKMRIAAISTEDFADSRQVLECYFSYDRRMGSNGYFVTWLPIERSVMGGVSFCVSNLVTTPVRLIAEAKRFSQKRADTVLGELLDEIETVGSVVRAAIRDDYDSILANPCKDWKLPDFDIAVLSFNAKQEALR